MEVWHNYCTLSIFLITTHFDITVEPKAQKPKKKTSKITQIITPYTKLSTYGKYQNKNLQVTK